MTDRGYQRVGIGGSGAIACGLAATASTSGEVVVLARSEQSAERARGRVEKLAGKIDGADVGSVRVTSNLVDLSAAAPALVVEAIVEDHDAKVELLSELGRECPDADLATTTSSLSIERLAADSGLTGRLFGLHVFNPVPQMELVEVCFPDEVGEQIRARAIAWCEGLGKRAVEVPDEAGFVVNRLLFPYLFDAVRLMERTGMEADEVDACMTLGAGHPMGPLALLDFVGVDVAVAIGEQLHGETGDEAHRPPALLRGMVERGVLGRKSGEGFHDYAK